jgi:uncharacterized protein (DUF849 family)
MDFCSRVYAFFANLVKTRQASVEVSDLDADAKITINLCTGICEDPCACSSAGQEDKKNHLDLSEITEKVDEVLQLLEEASVKDEDEEVVEKKNSNFYDEEDKDNNI